MNHHTENDFRVACGINDLAVGSGKLVVIAGVRVAVFRTADGYFALRDECPHEGASLGCGYLEGDVVRCRIHHWGFSVRSGKYVDEQRAGCDAATLHVRIRADQVEVDLYGLADRTAADGTGADGTGAET